MDEAVEKVAEAIIAARYGARWVERWRAAKRPEEWPLIEARAALLAAIPIMGEEMALVAMRVSLDRIADDTQAKGEQIIYEACRAIGSHDVAAAIRSHAQHLVGKVGD